MRWLNCGLAVRDHLSLDGKVDDYKIIGEEALALMRKDIACAA